MTQLVLTAIDNKNDTIYNLAAVCSIINAKLINFYFKTKYWSAHIGSGYLRFRKQYLEYLLIRRISFTTPPDRRAALVEQAKALCSEFLGVPEDLDRITRMDRIADFHIVNSSILFHSQLTTYFL